MMINIRHVKKEVQFKVRMDEENIELAVKGYIG